MKDAVAFIIVFNVGILFGVALLGGVLAISVRSFTLGQEAAERDAEKIESTCLCECAP